MSQTPHLKYRPDIDGLRAFAVLAVIGFHAFPQIVKGGFVGVDVFFVLSGFLISGIIFRGLQTGTFTYADFYSRRIKRIFPSLITVLVVSLTVGWFRLLPDEFKELGRQAAAGAGFVANLLFWSEAGYFDVAAEAKPLLHLWSLGIEEQFYFVWPIVLVVLFKSSRWMPVALCSLLVASFVANVWFVADDPTAVFYLPFTRFWELLLGAGLAYVAMLRTDLPAAELAHERRGVAELLSCIGAALLAASLLTIRGSDAFPGWWALLPTVGTLLLIASPNSWLNRNVLSNRLAVAIGLISYPLYLWHWVLLSFLRHAHDGADPPRLDRIAAVVLSFFLAWLTYTCVEKPLRFGKQGGRKTRFLFASMAAAAVAGAVVDVTDGVAIRYPPQIRPLAAFSLDREIEINERAYRADTCFLDLKEQTFADIGADCVDESDGKSQLLVLWGDSHAASLYPGLKRLQDRGGGFRLAQFTARACPPVAGMDVQRRKGCRPFDDAALARIAALKPDIVVLEGSWALYRGTAGWEKLDLAALQNTVGKLKALGVQRVVVFGSLPMWTIYQPRVGLRLWEQTQSLSDRSNLYRDVASIEEDRAIEAAMASTQAIFVSPIGLLCNADGCLISTEKNTPVPVTWDKGHLTEAGSELLIGSASASIFGPDLQPVAVLPSRSRL